MAIRKVKFVTLPKPVRARALTNGSRVPSVSVIVAQQNKSRAGHAFLAELGSGAPRRHTGALARYLMASPKRASNSRSPDTTLSSPHDDVFNASLSADDWLEKLQGQTESIACDLDRLETCLEDLRSVQSDPEHNLDVARDAFELLESVLDDWVFVEAALAHPVCDADEVLPTLRELGLKTFMTSETLMRLLSQVSVNAVDEDFIALISDVDVAMTQLGQMRSLVILWQQGFMRPFLERDPLGTEDQTSFALNKLLAVDEALLHQIDQWQPGQSLTSQDEDILNQVIAAIEELVFLFRANGPLGGESPLKEAALLFVQHFLISHLELTLNRMGTAFEKPTQFTLNQQKIAAHLFTVLGDLGGLVFSQKWTWGQEALSSRILSLRWRFAYPHAQALLTPDNSLPVASDWAHVARYFQASQNLEQLVIARMHGQISERALLGPFKSFLKFHHEVATHAFDSSVGVTSDLEIAMTFSLYDTVEALSVGLEKQKLSHKIEDRRRFLILLSSLLPELIRAIASLSPQAFGYDRLVELKATLLSWAGTRPTLVSDDEIIN